MMTFGLCTGAGAGDKWGVGYEHIALASRAGYDYVELPLFQMARMPEDVFEQEVLGRLQGARILCDACNCFLPGDVRLTGPEADIAKICEYVEGALQRAQAVGAKIVVMGSSGARNLMGGTSQHQGYQQLAAALRAIAPIAKKHGIQIVIEPLNRLESNIVNSYLSGLYLAALCGDPSIGPLVDSYHFFMDNEPLTDLAICPPMHVHYAELLGRKLPEVPSAMGSAFFAQLQAIGYCGRVSLEGSPGDDYEASIAQALQALRAMAK